MLIRTNSEPNRASSGGVDTSVQFCRASTFSARIDKRWWPRKSEGNLLIPLKAGSKNASSAEFVGGIRQLRRSPTYSSHSLPSNAWWRTRLGGKLRQGPPAAEGGGRRPALTGLATQPYSVHRERRLDAPADASAVQTRTDGCSKRDPNLDYFEAEWQFLGIIPEAVVTGLMQTPESLPVTAFLSLSKLHGARAG